MSLLLRYPVSAVSLLLLILPNVAADMPSPPPQVVTVFSRDIKVEAISYPATNETVVYQLNRDNSIGNTLWKFPKWFSRFEVSTDGDVLVVQNADLLPPDAQDDFVLLTFIRRGKVFGEITVKQLVGSHLKLLPTASHLSWGRGLYGIDVDGFAFVDTVVGLFIFDSKTAKCVFPPNN
jgi:hypothetical protein